MNSSESKFALPVALVVGVLSAGGAHAKLPTPTEEAKAQAAEATARTAWSNKVADFKLCQAMDRVAEHYAAEHKQAGKEAPPATATPPCADPGPFVPPASPKPAEEAAGAHSPPETAKSPPSGNAASAPATPEKK